MGPAPGPFAKHPSIAGGKKVGWEDVVKGYEYEKDRFIALKEEDFTRVDFEATQPVHIMHFVEIAEVNPLPFYKPCYMEPGK